MQSETVLDGTVRYRLVHLTFGPAEKLGLDIGIFTPAEGGPFPAIILQGGTPPGGTGCCRDCPRDRIREAAKTYCCWWSGPAAAPPVSDTAGATASTRPAGRGLPATAESMANQRADVFRRGYALVIFNPNDCAEDTTLRNPDGSWAFRNTRFYPAYPGL